MDRSDFSQRLNLIVIPKEKSEEERFCCVLPLSETLSLFDLEPKCHHYRDIGLWALLDHNPITSFIGPFSLNNPICFQFGDLFADATP